MDYALDQQTAGVSARAVALRMLSYQARTRTIRLATKLSDDQIRRLYHRAGLSKIGTRQRGRSPSSALQYTRNFAAQLESSICCGVLIKHGLLRAGRLPGRQGSLLYAQYFCDAYAEYLQLAHGEALSFEQAWYLVRTLAARGQLYLQHCPRCSSYFVRDAATVLKDQCPLCHARHESQKQVRQRRRR